MMSYDYQDEYNFAIGTRLLEPGEVPPLEGVQMYERGQFVYGAGPFAPGGPGGGMTIGPQFRTPGPAPGPMSCPQVSGGSLVCVQPPMTETGVATGRGWPPEIGPQEEQLMEVGCVATGRQCGGSPRAPAQYWCCPSAGSMQMPFIGTPFPTTSGGLGSNGFSTFLERYRTVMLVSGAAVLAWMAYKRFVKKEKVRLPGMKPYRLELQEMPISGPPIYNVTALPEGHMFAWISQDPKTGLWGVETDMADVRMEGFPTKEATADWAYDRRKDYEEMKFATGQAKDYMRLAREAKSASDAEKAYRYARRAAIAAIGVESDMHGEEGEPGPYYEDTNRLENAARALWISLEPGLEYELAP